MSETSGQATPSERGGLRYGRESVTGDQRERLRAAMAAACAEKGYAAVSVADVISRAGVSRSTFYEVYADKQACFLAAYDATVEGIWSRVFDALGRPGDWPVRLRAAITELLTALSEDVAATRLVMVEPLAAGDEAIRRYIASLGVLARAIDEGRAHSPHGDEVPPTAARGAVGGAAMMIREELMADRGDRLVELLPEILYAALVPYLEHDDALNEYHDARAAVS